MNPAIVICSRRESSRIPNKAFREVAGVPAIVHILKRCAGADVPVWLAVPPNQSNYYAKVARDNGAKIWASDPDSPLHRIAAFLNSNSKITHIVRVTHDDILIDAKTVKEMLEVARKSPDIGYIKCPNIVDGAGVEIMHRDNILAAAAKHGPTEYLSYFVKGRSLPKTVCFTHLCRTPISRNYRLTMDYLEDWAVLEVVLRAVGKYAPLDKVCSYLDHHTELLNINRLPLVSFYTCAKNAEKTIGKTISSVLNCGIDDFEYVVVDDGSTDNTVAEIAKFTRDKRLRLVVNGQNRGLASSSNIAASLSRGKYIMRVDADDVLIPAMFQSAFHDMARALNNGAAVVYPGYYEIGDTRRGNVIVKGDEAHHAGCALMLRSVLNELRFRDGLRHWDGLELYKRISQKGDLVSYYDFPIWFYRVHGSSMSRTSKAKRASLLVSLGLDGVQGVRGGKLC